MSKRMVDSPLVVDAWTEEARRLRIVAQSLGRSLDEAGLEVLSVHELRAARVWLERDATGRQERRWWSRGRAGFRPGYGKNYMG
ncbi:MAG TPA: hypothetical protein VN837_20740 [Chloroflexota bacterium]|nr:hypothetical protein [Chloroflexota bacterium]